MRRNGKFTRGGFEAAKKFHLCTSCRHHQIISWGDEPCPSCKRVDTRQFFHSKKELERGASLLMLRDHGKIRNLRFQPRFDLVVNGQKICAYTADAEYVDGNGQQIIEDTKPKDFITPEAKLKIAIFNAVFYPQTVTFYR